MKLKLIWDFRGQDAKGTAEHHRIHLEEFAERENLSIKTTGVEEKSPVLWTAFLIVEEAEMPMVRDALRPHRGEVAQ